MVNKMFYTTLGRSPEPSEIMRKSFQKPSPASNISNVGAKCQKCLKEGHWTADCTNERVYKPRPSRTALLFNPKLKLPEETIVKDDFVDEKEIKASVQKFKAKKAEEIDFADQLISEVKQGQHKAFEYEDDEEGQISDIKDRRNHHYEESRELRSRSYSPSRSRSPRGRDHHRRDHHRVQSRSRSRSPHNRNEQVSRNKNEEEKAEKKYTNYASDSDFSSDSE